MCTKQIIEGLQTLMPFYDNPDGFHTGADHDVIFGFETDKPLTPEALNKMIGLGWHQEYDGIDYDKEFSPEDYRPDESWHYYV